MPEKPDSLETTSDGPARLSVDDINQKLLKLLVSRRSDGAGFIEGIELGRVEFERPSNPVRLKAIAQLRASADPYLWTTRLADLQLLEDTPHPYSPTLGIEIEIMEESFIRGDEIELPKSEQKKIIKHRASAFDDIHRSGVPLDDSDPWREFALQPSNSYLTQFAELELFDQLGVIDLEQNYYSLHINVGGITAEGIVGNESLLLARALESTGWASSGYRLLKPYFNNAKIFSLRYPYGWASPKGLGGVIPRSESKKRNKKIEVNAEVLEFRTFMAHGEENLKNTLEGIYYLAACLAAFQDLNYSTVEENKFVQGDKVITTRPRVRQGCSIEDAVLLAELWVWFSDNVKILFQEKGLKNPAEQWKEPMPKRLTRPRDAGDFLDLANAVHSDDEFKLKMQHLVELATSRAKDIIG